MSKPAPAASVTHPDQRNGSVPAPNGVASSLGRAMLAPVALLAVLRIFSSYTWLAGALQGSDAKLRSGFLSGAGLFERVVSGPNAFATHAAFPALGRWLPGFVAAAPATLAWLLALGELAVGLSLLLGLLTRLGGLFAVVQAIVQTLAAAGNGADTIGHNYLLALTGLIVLVAGAGRKWGIDAVLLTRWPRSRLLHALA